MGFQRCGAFIPTLGSGGPQWVPVELMCLSVFTFFVCISVSLSSRLHRFLAIKVRGL